MRNNLIIAVIFVALAAVLYMLFIKPWVLTAYEKYKHVQQLNLLLERADQIQQKRDELQSLRINLSEEKERRINEAVPKNTVENKIQFFISLDKMLIRSGFAPDVAYSVGAERRGNDANIVIPVSFTFGQISYDVLRGFVNNLQRWERGVRIVSIKISSEGAFESAELIGGATVVIEALFSDVSANTSP